MAVAATNSTAVEVVSVKRKIAEVLTTQAFVAENVVSTCPQSPSPSLIWSDSRSRSTTRERRAPAVRGGGKTL